jgi:hypothetical protein
MKSNRIIKACRGSRAVRLAAGLVVLTAAAAGVGLVPGGAGAATNGWGRTPNPVVVQPAPKLVTPPVAPASGEPTEQAITSANGWG